jgi:hypothetical protein
MFKKRSRRGRNRDDARAKRNGCATTSAPGGVGAVSPCSHSVLREPPPTPRWPSASHNGTCISDPYPGSQKLLVGGCYEMERAAKHLEYARRASLSRCASLCVAQVRVHADARRTRRKSARRCHIVALISAIAFAVLIGVFAMIDIGVRDRFTDLGREPSGTGAHGRLWTRRDGGRHDVRDDCRSRPSRSAVR